MNTHKLSRREVFQAAAALSIPIHNVESIDAHKKIVAFVLTVDTNLNQQQIDALTLDWKSAMKGTTYENTKVVILQKGTTLQMVSES